MPISILLPFIIDVQEDLAVGWLLTMPLIFLTIFFSVLAIYDYRVQVNHRNRLSLLSSPSVFTQYNGKPRLIASFLAYLSYIIPISFFAPFIALLSVILFVLVKVSPLPFIIELILAYLIVRQLIQYMKWFVFGRFVSRGEFYEAYHNAKRMRRLIFFIGFQKAFLESDILMQAFENDLKTYKWLLREKVEILLKDSKYAGETLGSTITSAQLMIRDREFSESLPFVEAAISMSPNSTLLIDLLVYWYLEQSVYPERALEIIDYAFRYELESGDKTVFTIRKAYALALLGKNAKAEESLSSFDENVLEQVPPDNAADIFHYAGLTEQKLGNLDKAKTYFEKAIARDLDGIFGRRAKESLDNLGSN